MPSSSAGDAPPWSARHAGVGEERLQPVVQADLAVGDVEQRAVAAVPVEEHEPLGRRHRRRSGRCRRARRAACVADSQTVPGDQACSLRLRVGAAAAAATASSSSPAAVDGRLGDALGDDRVGVEAAGAVRAARSRRAAARGSTLRSRQPARHRRRPRDRRGDGRVKSRAPRYRCGRRAACRMGGRRMPRPCAPATDFDAIVVGAGHNGLVMRRLPRPRRAAHAARRGPRRPSAARRPASRSPAAR